jgi:hypothetical protein
MFDWDTYANEDYDYEFNRVVSDSEEFSYDDDGWDYDDEERSEVAILEEEYRSWYENEMIENM